VSRTAVSYTALVANAYLADPAGTTIDSTLVTAGVTIANAVPEETVIRVANTFAGTKVVTIGAGDSPPSTYAGQGAITGTVAASTGVGTFGPFTSARVLKSDGSMTVDFASGMTGTITVFRVPRTA
jgi:hypothetical protein